MARRISSSSSPIRASEALEHLADLGVVAVLGQQLARARGVVGRAPVLDGEQVGRLELAVRAPDLGVALAVADDRGVGH